MQNHERTNHLAISLVVALATIGCKSSEASNDDGPDLSRASTADLKAGKQIFETTCSSCHTIGQGDRVGPDLHGIDARRDTAWLVRWMKDPMGMSKSDPAGRELLAKYKNVPMPPPGLDDEGIRKVLSYVVFVSKKTAAPAEAPGAKGDGKRADVGQEKPAGL